MGGCGFSPPEKANALLAEGWGRGKPQSLTPEGRESLRKNAKEVWVRRKGSPTKGLVWIHIAEKGKMVPREDLPIWEAQGWSRGEPSSMKNTRRQRKGAATSQYGKKFAFIWKPGTCGSRKIPLEDLPSALAEGWVRGMNPAGRSNFSLKG